MTTEERNLLSSQWTSLFFGYVIALGQHIFTVQLILEG